MKEYTVDISGIEHTFLLEEEDQKRRVPQAKAIPEHPYQAAAEAKEADKPANKSGTAANK